jgi:tRNA pseudouridine55 synthase
MKSENEIDGVLLVDKATGMTSHDVVAITRRALNTKKVGHCGTLDPLATGLLLITIGRGTKIQDLLMSEDKEYVGTLELGKVTDSQDADGVVTEARPVPELAREQIDAAFAKFHGDFYQMPPMVSAIKKDGVPLYKLARQGKVVEREPRFVHVYAHDIGQELGCGAHLKSLRRTKSGRFNVDGAITVEELKAGPLEAVSSRVMSLPAVSRLRGA